MKIRHILLAFLVLAASACPIRSGAQSNLSRAEQTLDAIRKFYSEKETELLRENYPFDKGYSASYLAEADTGAQKHFAYLWPFSGTFSGVNALMKTTGDKKFLEIIESKTLPALYKYYDTRRMPPAYASYLNNAPLSDRFYDDNVWIGIDFLELHAQTADKTYLEKAKEVWRFIESGTDDVLNGGIYWCEQKKRSKNSCSNAPGAVMALKLFEATKDSSYFHQGVNLYNWTKENLQDPDDLLYWDNISVRGGRVDKRKYPYNSGQMLQAASLLYKLTGEKQYLHEAQNIAKAAILYFTDEFTGENQEKFRLMKPGNVWFVAVMMRGFTELYHLDKNREYLDVFNKSLDYAWKHARDTNGLFQDNWAGRSEKKTKWLLDQAAFVEMFAAIAAIIE